MKARAKIFAYSTRTARPYLALFTSAPRRSSVWPGQFLRATGELEIERGDSPGVVGDEVHGDAIVDVAPLGMVVQPLGLGGDRGHELEGLREIREDEAAVELAVLEFPARQVLQSTPDVVGGELLRSWHVRASCPVVHGRIGSSASPHVSRPDGWV